jgi:hypothetical protein
VTAETGYATKTQYLDNNAVYTLLPMSGDSDTVRKSDTAPLTGRLVDAFATPTSPLHWMAGGAA